MQSSNGVEDNIMKIAQLFPDCVTETVDERTGQLKHLIDFEKLKQNLSDSIMSERAERYQFTWPDKSKAILLANSPVNATLRPCREESVDFDNTQNLYIEGDNLDVLKCLKETYLHKVKMIYIDPPYNTGNDFVYEDDFAQSSEEYLANSGQYDEQGNRMFTNAESNGRFHTDWLNMIYPRLKVARDLLTDDGVIFISIDDNEVENLRKVCDEVFGESNFIAQFIWRGGRRNAAKFISTSHEYILCFAKSLTYCNVHNICWHEKKKGLEEIYKKAEELKKKNGSDFLKSSIELKAWYKSLPDDSESKNHSHYNWIDANGVYFASDISRGGGGGPQWDIINPNTHNVVKTPQRGWAYSNKEDLIKDIQNGLIHFNGDGVPCKKRYLKDNETQLKETVFYKDRRGSSKRLRFLMGSDCFSFPKDEEILSNFIASFTEKDSLILDFFSGSATTAHAVMQLNAEDGGNRKFIMVQLPELTYTAKTEKYKDGEEEKERYIIDEATGHPAVAKDSDARKAGYYTIPEIGKERIRRAGKKIKEESPLTTQDLDTGFRVLKLDSTNMENIYYSPKDISQADLFTQFDNVKSDRTGEDLLFQVMLELGATLDSKIESTTVDGKTIYNVAEGYLVACFDMDVTDEVVTAIAKMQPAYAVLRDTSMKNDATATNFEQIFKTYSPDTTTRII